jgi:hypothetical protein
MIPDSAIQHLKSSFRGQIFCPGDPGYDEARTVPNAMIDRRPAVIARCAGAADVIACVRIAREHNIFVSFEGAATASPAKPFATAAL